MKKFVYTLIAAMVTVCAFAVAPNSSGTYYQNANGKKGSALKTAMCGIIYNRTEKTYNYLWTAFQTTDVRSDGKIWDMYSSITNYTPGGSAQGANYSKEGDSYNREHSFPQSWFNSNAPMYTDLHHIYPTDGFVNSKRSNFPFGETTGNKYKSSGSFSKLGACSLSGYSGTVFEPADEYKGDFARTYFYMVTCYEEKLADWYAGNADGVRATIDGSTYPGLQIWQLNMLLKWAKNDPVSQKEIDRNNAVYGIQNNRNPFIDYPGLEQYIWGSKKDDTFSYNNYVVPTEYSTEYNEGSGSGSGGGGSGSGTGEDKTITLTYDSFGLTTTYAVKTATVDSYGFTVNQGYKGTGDVIQMNSSKGSGILYNTTAIPGLTSITVNVSSGNKTYTITTGTAQNPTANSQTGTTGGTYNAVNGDSYFQLSVSGASYFSSIVITYNDSGSGSTATDPTFSGLADLNVDYGSTLTLTQGTAGTENIVTDGTVTLESSNEAVVTVDGLTITPVAVGTAIITINAAASENYNAGSTMAEITVNAPEGQEAAPSTGGETNILLFGESFGVNNTDKARDWNDSYSVKSGIEAVYSGISGYTSVNARQGKDGTGTSGSGLNQKTSGTDASIIIGPLNVADYSNMNLTYQWKAGSISGTYTTTAYYATSSTGSYTELTGSGTGATTFVERSYSLPAAAQGSTLYLKIVWNTSNTGAVIDEVQLRGSSSGSPAPISVTTTGGYATYCYQYPLDLDGISGAKAYIVNAIDTDNNKLTLTQITGTIKGGVPFVLKADGADDTFTIPLAASSTNVPDGNLLVGTLAPTFVAQTNGDYTHFAYSKSNGCFVKLGDSGNTVPANRAYLPINLGSGNLVKAFSIVFEETDGVREMDNGEFTIQNSQFTIIHNLAGQRINNSQLTINSSQLTMNNGQLRKGIYIVNGKKVLVK